ncbi:DsrE family protein [Geomonas sp. Red69]|uniref:DsrE family protein n=1 Tax=Geomonas diazotrophica TaxID=2843197 RepID=A0ABX8JLD3_9BACT|nr:MULTISPECIES: DsrE family protein [Geomonas]MBU5635514.1 DsrE family protein [Geomonas diazotrophica]QWV97434.1 DsrE family protein [Geomonas nitrogeniifigens]QXE86592.1 DsrE family protein [Geomonas nitrogeniifigens]
MLRRLLFSLLFLLLSVAVAGAAPKAEDHDALAGLKSARVIFDARVPDWERLVFNLELIAETFDGMTAQGVRPEMVVSFRGPGVKLLTAPVINKEALELIRELKKKGVRFEACAVAMRVFKVDPALLVPEVKLVGNVLTSLIGYQNKGYAMITVN